MYQSVIQERGRVDFPGFQAERHYMIPFFQKYGLPPAIRHWQPTVDAMLSGIYTDQPIYFMADQSFVKAGDPQRRPGVHVDGYWHPEKLAHGGGGHRGYGGHLPRGRHRGRGGHGGSHMSSGWDDAASAKVASVRPSVWMDWTRSASRIISCIVALLPRFTKAYQLRLTATAHWFGLTVRE